MSLNSLNSLRRLAPVTPSTRLFTKYISAQNVRPPISPFRSVRFFAAISMLRQVGRYAQVSLAAGRRAAAPPGRRAAAEALGRRGAM